MTVTKFHFRIYICVQIFITIERVMKIFYFGRTVPLSKMLDRSSKQSLLSTPHVGKELYPTRCPYQFLLVSPELRYQYRNVACP